MPRRRPSEFSQMNCPPFFQPIAYFRKGIKLSNVNDEPGSSSREQKLGDDDKEKLFLPYFSTKGRGTGLGLAIVNRILADHDATVRVEDNLPAGARFIVELPIRTAVEPDVKTTEAAGVEIRS